ncbi:hypothetical protein [Bacillus sp. BC08]
MLCFEVIVKYVLTDDVKIHIIKGEVTLTTAVDNTIQQKESSQQQDKDDPEEGTADSDDDDGGS